MSDKKSKLPKSNIIFCKKCNKKLVLYGFMPLTGEVYYKCDPCELFYTVTIKSKPFQE